MHQTFDIEGVHGFVADRPLALALGLFLLALVLASGCATRVTPVALPPRPAAYRPAPQPHKPAANVVKASWYGTEFAGRPTTSGERFDPNRMTAASKSLPLGSVVKVENPRNGQSVTVRINDCGPFVHGRSLDLSKRAAQKIGITHAGIASVKLTTLQAPADGASCAR